MRQRDVLGKLYLDISLQQARQGIGDGIALDEPLDRDAIATRPLLSIVDQ